MPGVSPFVGRTEEEARDKYDRLTSLILEEDGIGLLNGLTGGTLDLKGYDLDGPLRQHRQRGHEEPPGSDPPDRRREQFLDPPALPMGRIGTRSLHDCRNAVQIADTLQQWFENEAADGFNILPPWLPTGLNDFVDLVIPSCNAAGSSAPPTRAGRSAKTSACRSRSTLRRQPSGCAGRRMRRATMSYEDIHHGRAYGLNLAPDVEPAPRWLSQATAVITPSLALWSCDRLPDPLAGLVETRLGECIRLPATRPDHRRLWKALSSGASSMTSRSACSAPALPLLPPSDWHSARPLHGAGAGCRAGT